MDPLYRFLYDLELPDTALQNSKSLLDHLMAFYVEVPFTQLMRLARGYSQVKTLLESKEAKAFWQAKLKHDYPGLAVLGKPWRQRYLGALRLATHVRRLRTGVVDAHPSQTWILRHPVDAQTVGFFSLATSTKAYQMMLTHLPTRTRRDAVLPPDTRWVLLRHDHILVIRELVYDIYDVATLQPIVAAPPLNAAFDGLRPVNPDILPDGNLVIMLDTAMKRMYMLDVGVYARRIVKPKLTFERLRQDCMTADAIPAHSDYVRRFGTVFRTDGSDPWKLRPEVTHGPFWGSEGIYALATDEVGNIKVHRLRDRAVEPVEINPALVADPPDLVCVYGEVLLWRFPHAGMCMLSVRGHSVCLRVPGEAVLLDEDHVYIDDGGGKLRRVELEAVLLAQGVSVGAACVGCGAELSSSVLLPFCAVECQT